MVSHRRVRYQDAFLVLPFGLQEILLMLCGSIHGIPEQSCSALTLTLPRLWWGGVDNKLRPNTPSGGRQHCHQLEFSLFSWSWGLNCVFNFHWLIGLKTCPVAFQVSPVSTVTYTSLHWALSSHFLCVSPLTPSLFLFLHFSLLSNYLCL